ncbi:MAG: hypothetical protein DMF58_08905 [Acidobacteria bacterium]|nr:MAG: hypothetical protein DMF58_08905 [Acidobacteriota bacterium]
MSRVSRALAIAIIAAVALAGCKKEKGQAAEEPEAFAFTVYPGSQYLAPLTELDKKANALMHPNQPQPPIAIYDTDAPLETVAAYYAKSYGYGTVAPDATNNLSARM